MTGWLLAAIALAVGFVLCGLVCVRARTVDRVIAVELGSLLAALEIVLLAEAFHRDFLYDLALTLTLLSFASTMVFAHFLERWL